MSGWRVLKFHQNGQSFLRRSRTIATTGHGEVSAVSQPMNAVESTVVRREWLMWSLLFHASGTPIVITVHRSASIIPATEASSGP
ncbi:hypothetical protein UPYG_G00086830 [Umbra pygmaea]|uniref:Uncharacterized protein n=1 Tax=Umbra pygmaea TaxID=75934 RepID=A0ABD0XHL7_UMBPY